jgi:ribose 5-phosphate isomerase A
MNPKQRAAEASLKFVRDGMVVGLGTGSTADYFLQALAAALREGRLKNVRGIPTSRQSERRAEHLGIPLITLADAKPDVTIDGADEVAPNLDLIKGLGGALLREKIVAQNSGQLIIIADTGKAVPKLGTKSPLPVEVAQFAHEVHADFFRSLGATPTLRKTQDGAIYVTDNGNYICDCRFAAIDDAAALDVKLHSRAGVVETGLFVGIASVAMIADENGVEERRRTGA